MYIIFLKKKIPVLFHLANKKKEKEKEKRKKDNSYMSTK